MRRATGLAVGVVLAFCTTGCSTLHRLTHWNGQPGSSLEFVAGNSHEVVIDLDQGSDRELDAARKLAVSKCGLFGQKTATLDSINLKAGDRQEAIFLCQ